MLELAELWDPDIPITENTAYIERSRELNKDMESALMNLKTADKEDAA
jgi:CPA2 family monovalent cation:H+ antiporter-2